LQSMGPAPSADLVGSIIGVDAGKDGDYKQQRATSTTALRKISRTSSSASVGSVSSASGEAATSQSAKSDAGRMKLTETPIVWRNVAIMLYLHMAALYGFYLCFGVAKAATIGWAFFLFLFGGFGITGGAHRLWAHRSYKAKWPLRVFAAVAQTIAVQNDIYEWSRDHRVHHKFSETDADPHNARRGFFFAHVGWLLMKKHPEVKRRGATVDCSDLLQDPVVIYQRKFYVPLVLLLSFAMPAWVPWYFWGESFKTAFFVASIFRYVFNLNITWLVNSAAHIWGNHPYDNNINPAENLYVAFLTSGEGWHNYHHVFPWDYKAAELGNYKMNMTTAAIDLFNWLGLAYDLKTVPESVIRGRVQRTGDGTHPFSFEDSPLAKEMKEEEMYCSIWEGCR